MTAYINEYKKVTCTTHAEVFRNIEIFAKTLGANINSTDGDWMHFNVGTDNFCFDKYTRNETWQYQGGYCSGFNSSSKKYSAQPGSNSQRPETELFSATLPFTVHMMGGSTPFRLYIFMELGEDKYTSFAIAKPVTIGDFDVSPSICVAATGDYLFHSKYPSSNQLFAKYDGSPADGWHITRHVSNVKNSSYAPEELGEFARLCGKLLGGYTYLGPMQVAVNNNQNEGVILGFVPGIYCTTAKGRGYGEIVLIGKRRFMHFWSNSDRNAGFMMEISAA